MCLTAQINAIGIGFAGAVVLFTQVRWYSFFWFTWKPFQMRCGSQWGRFSLAFNWKKKNHPTFYHVRWLSKICRAKENRPQWRPGICLGFLVEVQLVKFAVLVLTLLNQLTAAVDVDVEILIQLDYALVEAVLFLYGALIHVKLVLQLDLALLLVTVAVIIEHTHNLRLCHYLLLKRRHIKLGIVLEESHGAAQQVGLVGTVHVKLLGQLLCHEVTCQVHHVLSLEIRVLTAHQMQIVIYPVTGTLRVGLVNHSHHIAFLALVIHNERTLVQTAQVHAVHRCYVKALLIMLNGDEGLLVLNLEQAYSLIYVTAYAKSGYMSHDKVTALDLGMLAVLIKMCSQVYREVIEHIRIVEYVAHQAVDAVILKSHIIMEDKTLLTLECPYKILCKQGIHILTQRIELLGADKRLLISLIAHIMQRHAAYLHLRHLLLVLAATGQVKNLIRDGLLAQFVVLERKLAYQVVGILGCSLHGNHAGSLLTGK